MPVLTLDLTLTEGEADRIAALLHTDREATENGLTAYIEAKVTAARAREAARDAHHARLAERVAKIRARAEQ